MNKRIQDLTVEMEKRPGASAEALRSLASFAWVDLPLDYVDFLRASNGAEGPVGRSYLEVWPAEDVLRLNEEYRAKEFLPGLMLFGSSLGGVAYGFDGRGDKATIAEVPFDSMNPESVIRRGSSLQELLEFLVMQWPEG